MTINRSTLAECVSMLVQPAKGILAADESLGTISKRFAPIGVESTPESRRDYRVLLCESSGLEQFISGVILFEESLSQQSPGGLSIPKLLSDKGIVPGIKVDKGTIPLADSEFDTLTQGLDGLGERLASYRSLGARFAKWRNVYRISIQPGKNSPSELAITSGAEILARYAALCQHHGLVPIVEPEVLMDGDHDIARCAQVTSDVQHAVFDALYRHGVDPELMLLKPNMVLPGKSGTPASAEEIAQATLKVLRRNVPAAVPSINFLSGGLGPEDATTNLNAINLATDLKPAPWLLSFSFGRALQQPVLAAWQGQTINIPSAQAALLHRAKANCAAMTGSYDAASELAGATASHG